MCKRHFYKDIYLNETKNNWKTLAMQLDSSLLNSTQIQQQCIQVNYQNTVVFFDEIFEN